MQQQKPPSMSKQTSLIAQRAWELLRALLGARKGELCRNRVALAANIFHKLVRKLMHSTNESRTALLYGDHEFSFQSTPVVHVRMHRPASALRFKLPHIPCIGPPQADCSDCDEEEEDDVMWGDRVNRTCYLKEEEEEDDVMWGDRVNRTCYYLKEEEEMSEDSSEGIDKRATEFIAKFFEEMKK